MTGSASADQAAAEAAPGGDGTAEGRHKTPRSFVLLRRVEVDTPVHRLWAGTKLLAVAALSITVSYVPTWPAVAVMAALVLGTALVARIPAGAVPRFPTVFWLVMLTGALLTVASGGSPEIAVAGVHLGLGNVDTYVRFTAVSFVLLGAAALVGWTTALGDVGPAVSRLLTPLRWLRVPVDEWAIAIALCVRSLPLLVGEVRVLVAARRLRPSQRQGLRHYLGEAFDLLAAALSVSLRRSGEMAEAMTARGGTTSITARLPGPRLADAVAILVVAGACVGAWMLPSG